MTSILPPENERIHARRVMKTIVADRPGLLFATPGSNTFRAVDLAVS